MQQMPSTTPDSRTISRTSSVMSVTCSPPVVRKCRSAWKTFIGVELTSGGRRRHPIGMVCEGGAVRFSSARHDHAGAGP